MKKLLLPIVALLCFSCSSDDDDTAQQIFLPPSTNSFTATIDGVAYTFDKVSVETVTVNDPDYSYVDLHIIAEITTDETKTIEFNCEQDVAGANSIYWFYSSFNGVDFDYDYEEADIAFAANLTVNSNKRLVGNFSGTLDTFDDNEQITVTNGNFDITY